MTFAKSLSRSQKRGRPRRASREDPTLVFKNFVRALEKLRPAVSGGAHAPAAAVREKP
jgi:hypothetical protein